MAIAAKTAKKSEGRIAGCLLAESSIGHIYTALKDGKFHTIASLKSCLTAKGVNINNRLRRLHRKGLRTKQWRLVIEGDRVKMVTGKPPAGAVMRERAEKEEKPAAKKKTAREGKMKSDKSTSKANVQDVPVDDED